LKRFNKAQVPQNASCAVRYFLVVVAATTWTFTFRFWKKLGQKKPIEVTEKVD